MREEDVADTGVRECAAAKTWALKNVVWGARPSSHAHSLGRIRSWCLNAVVALTDTATRTVNHHVMPYGTNEGSLPAIATFFGVAITADARSLATLAPSSLPPHVPRGPELGYLFGADAGARYLDPTGSFALLKTARTDLEGHLSPSDPDLHSAWTQLVRGAAEIPKGTVPSFDHLVRVLS